MVFDFALGTRRREVGCLGAVTKRDWHIHFVNNSVSVSEAGVLASRNVFIFLYKGWACPRVATGFRMHTSHVTCTMCHV